MLFSRYGAGTEQIMNMDFELGCEYIATAIENYQEEKTWLRWIHYDQNIAYQEFKENLGIIKSSEDERTEESILCTVKNILNGTRVKTEDVEVE